MDKQTYGQKMVEETTLGSKSIEKYRVEQIIGGPHDGKYGIFKGDTLYKTFRRQGSAIADKNRRNRDLGKSTGK